MNTEIDRALIEREYNFIGDMTHLDICAVGIPPARTQLASNTFMVRYMPLVYDCGRVSFDSLRSNTRALMGKLIGASADSLSYVGNTTIGNSMLAWGYPMGADDNVVVCDLENGANLFPWIQASRSRGFKVKLVRTNGRSVTSDELIEAMDEHTRIVAVSLVQAGTGSRVDTAKLATACAKRGAVLAVDAIQAVGRLRVDVEREGIGALSCGSFKGLLSGFGTGFFFCRDDVAERSVPVLAGSGCIEDEPEPPRVFTGEFVLKHGAARFDSATSNTAGIAMLEQSLSFIHELVPERIERHVLSLDEELREEFSRVAKLDVLPVSELPSGVVVARYKDEDGAYERVSSALREADIRLTHRRGYLRMGIGIHNTSADMEKTARILREALR